MWLLVVASCIAGDPGPQCGSGISPTYYTAQEDCADAAVVYHDTLRMIAQANGDEVLVLDTRCVRIDLGGGA
jgi:hypothetical protein